MRCHAHQRIGIDTISTVDHARCQTTRAIVGIDKGVSFDACTTGGYIDHGGGGNVRAFWRSKGFDKEEDVPLNYVPLRHYVELPSRSCEGRNTKRLLRRAIMRRRKGWFTLPRTIPKRCDRSQTCYPNHQTDPL